MSIFERQLYVIGIIFKIFYFMFFFSFKCVCGSKFLGILKETIENKNQFLIHIYFVLFMDKLLKLSIVE